MRIFIIGPMSFRADSDHNYPAFQDAAARLRHWGYNVKSPTELDDGNRDRSWEYYMKESLRMLLDCNTIAMLPGWEKSRGAKLELQLARELGYLVIDAQTLAPIY